MENFSYAPSYPESANSTPRSREIDFENPPQWEDNQPHLPQKVKFMCSYGGKILPRPHDNQLSYMGGETKIVSVERNIKFNSLITKLLSLSQSDNVTIKYQLPDEDLDALISVTNDDDLDNMMHEYDRLCRASPRPARLRLFLFPANQPLPVGGSGVVPSEKEKFVEELNSGPVSPALVSPAKSNADFLFGLEKELSVGPPIQQPHQPVKLRDEVHEAEVRIPEVVSDQIQKHIEDLQRLRLEEQQRLYRSKSDTLVREKVPPLIVPAISPTPVGYWPEKQSPGGGRVYQTTSLGGEQPVYMVSQPTGVSHALMMRAINQGYSGAQGVPPEAHRVPPPVVVEPPTFQPQGPQKVAPLRYTEGISMERPPWAGEQYPQVVYDGLVGRQIYFNGPGGQVTMGPPRTHAAPTPQYQAVVAENRPAAGLLKPDGGKVVVPKAPQGGSI